MGLLSRLAGLAPAKAPSDDALLIHAMFLMAGADGNFDDEEISVIRGFANSLPEFKNTTEQEFQALIGEAKKVARKFETPQASVAALSALSTTKLKQKAFLLAADIALASGDVDEDEDALLESMGRVLSIDENTANTIINVLAIKYVP
ncbi:MAG TPA: tellurite resistance TerB family protein [Polyangiaceae bacterium]|nr:tellurite resistance TerB family protein [Polyangiaceae bacterium]